MKKTLTTYLKISSTCLLIFTIFAVSIPTHEAVAGGLSGGATLGLQIKQQAELSTSAIQNTLTAGNTGLTAAATTQNFVKENLLDGIGWAIAKQMVSQMTQSLVTWINSGFQGSPAFITDLDSFLLDALDTAAGEYIKNLGGGIGKFICSPFKLDIQAALTVAYDQARSGLPSGPTANACKASDIGDNIRGFFEGAGSGDWGDWLEVSSNPQNTPYGGYLEAQTRLNIKLQNEAGQEIEIASWGDGFLSKRICEAVEGTSGNTNQTNCKITTPGQVISEALTFQLSTGPRALIEADEINEVIGALLNQITLQAMQGINGLLGLGGNNTYTNTDSEGRSYLDAANEEAVVINTDLIKRQMNEALITERSYFRLATSTLTDASTRLTLVEACQIAIDQLFASTSRAGDLLNITKASTLTAAKESLENERTESNSTSKNAELNVITSQLTAISNSLSLIGNMSDSVNLGADLSDTSFIILEQEGTAIRNSIAAFANELIVIVPTVDTNITTLEGLILRYNNASSTATTRNNASSTNKTRSTAQIVRNEIAIEFSRLAGNGTLSTESEIEINRVKWRQKLQFR